MPQIHQHVLTILMMMMLIMSVINLLISFIIISVQFEPVNWRMFQQVDKQASKVYLKACLLRRSKTYLYGKSNTVPL